MKICELYGRKVLGDGGKEGYLLSINAAEDGAFFLVCADEREREFSVDIKNVVRFGEKIIFSGGADKKIPGTPLRAGRECFDTDGRFLGRVEEYVFTGGRLKSCRIGKKNYPAEGLRFCDAVIVRCVGRLKCDVTKDGATLFKKGSPVTDELLEEAACAGEYVQTKLKSL